MKRIMAVYDVDPFYASKFAEYANRNEKIPFMAVAFTSMGRLQAYTMQQPVELLLVGDDVTAKELEEIKVGQIVRLSETGMAMDDKPIVYKYQSSDQILREVMACYEVEAGDVAYLATGKKCTIIGVYSPVHRCGKTGFAITMGQILAKESRVLYISLEKYAGLERWMGTEHHKTLSDLLYYFRQGQYSSLRLSAVVHSFHELAYIPPVTYGEDLADISGDELSRLVTFIAKDSGYDTIILDIGDSEKGVEALLELCSVIYVPAKEDGISTIKLETWKRYLEKSRRAHLWERAMVVRLPHQSHVALPEQYLEQLLWGEVGDYVRCLLKGQRTEWSH